MRQPIIWNACNSIIAWQVEHEAVDPLGMEHSWRLDAEFVAAEVEAVRQSDPTRPILMNGFLPVSLPVLAVGLLTCCLLERWRLFGYGYQLPPHVRAVLEQHAAEHRKELQRGDRFRLVSQAALPVLLSQWWQTRDQGDSLAVAQRLADIVGVDYYPRHALLGTSGATVYLDASRSPWQHQRLMRLFAWARARGKRLMISECQAEPWEAVTTPPSPRASAMFSCRPEDVIDNYNRCLRWARQAGFVLDAYLFWGAEYWILRDQHGDSSYRQAFVRILERA